MAYTCANCGTPLEKENSSDRESCPKCGSKSRNISLKVHDSIMLTSATNAEINLASLPVVLLKTITVPGKKTPEGRIIEAVTVPRREIVEFLAKDPNVAFQISTDKWEEIVADAYKKAGSDFAPRIKEDPLITPHIPARLELINGPTLIKRLKELAC